MPLPPRQPELHTLTADQARTLCFGPPDVRWDRPGTFLVSGRLCSLIRRARARDAGVAGREKELFEETRNQLWLRFEHIWSLFRASDRPQVWSDFEAYLHVSVRNELGHSLRRLVGRERVAAKSDAAELAVEGPFEDRLLAQWDAQRLARQALASLGDDERTALLDPQLSTSSAEETAERLGRNVGSLYKLRHQAFHRFRTEVIAILARDVLGASHPDELEDVVRYRCRDGHPCFLYKLDCSLARGPEELSRETRAASAAKVSAGIDWLAREIMAALDERGLSPDLDACYWERWRKRARPTDDS
jgi:DNA-directed RNA polymerase specialized sigma24 family protein